MQGKVWDISLNVEQDWVAREKVQQLVQMFEFIYYLLIFSEYFPRAEDQFGPCCISFLGLL